MVLLIETIQALLPSIFILNNAIIEFILHEFEWAARNVEWSLEFQLQAAQECIDKWNSSK